MATTYLLIIGDREALGWILSTRRMAFPDATRSEVRSLGVGDRLMIYTTRGAFKNPTRDRGRVIGTGTVKSAVRLLDKPVWFGQRKYPVGCTLEIDALVTFGSGVELSPLVPELETFEERKQGWATLLRRPLLRLAKNDAELIEARLKMLSPKRADGDVLDEYARWYQPPGRQGCN